jgi:hypothetical protein
VPQNGQDQRLESVDKLLGVELLKVMTKQIKVFDVQRFQLELIECNKSVSIQVCAANKLMIFVIGVS